VAVIVGVKVGRLTTGVKDGVTTGVNVWATRGDIPSPIKTIKKENRILFIISRFNLVAVCCHCEECLLPLTYPLPQGARVY
jgi:hypothetical protein